MKGLSTVSRSAVLKAIGSRVKIPETRVDILFITLPEALKPENAKIQKG